MDLKDTIRRFCEYQERSHFEVRTRLRNLGASSEERDELIGYLIESGLLNEERFARAIARGKFRLLQWGRIKIVETLRRHQVSERNIEIGLTEIDDQAYMETLGLLLRKKAKEISRHSDPATRKAKLFQYARSKGYEPNVITSLLPEVT